LDWGSFGTGVAVTVVGGLIVWAIIASFHWYGRRRERKAKEIEARNFERIPLRAGAVQIAQELRENAEVAKRFEGGHRAPREGKAISLVQWKNFKGQIAQLQTEAPELW
jgi:hypothetical protein